MTPEKKELTTTTDGQPARPGLENASAPAPINPATGQHEAYWVLTPAERAKGFVRPLRHKYIHTTCGGETRMSQDIAETYARQPDYYGATFCVHCRAHFMVGERGQFTWEDGGKVGT